MMREREKWRAQVIFLFSSMPAKLEQRSQIAAVDTILSGSRVSVGEREGPSAAVHPPKSTIPLPHRHPPLPLLQVYLRHLDAVAPENKDERNRLFEVSGKRGVFPQVFLQNGAEIKYLGGYDEFFSANESEATDGTLSALLSECPRDEQQLANLIKIAPH
jgi:hypothetical protein